MNAPTPSPRSLAIWLRENDIEIPPEFWALTEQQTLGRSRVDSDETASWVAQWTLEHLGFVSKPGFPFRAFWQTLPWDVILVGLVNEWEPSRIAYAVRAGVTFVEAQHLAEAPEEQWRHVEALAALRSG